MVSSHSVRRRTGHECISAAVAGERARHNQRLVQRMQLEMFLFHAGELTAFNAASLLPRANCSPCSSLAFRHDRGSRPPPACGRHVRFQHFAGHRRRRRFGDKHNDSVCGSFSSIPMASSIIRPPISRSGRARRCQSVAKRRRQIQDTDAQLLAAGARCANNTDVARRTALPKLSAAPLIIAVPQLAPSSAALFRGPVV